MARRRKFKTRRRKTSRRRTSKKKPTLFKRIMKWALIGTGVYVAYRIVWGMMNKEDDGNDDVIGTGEKSGNVVEDEMNTQKGDLAKELLEKGKDLVTGALGNILK